MQNKDITGVRAEIATLRAFPDKMTWDALATKYGVNKGLLWRIVNRGHEPKDATVRHALGLPALVSVAPCPDCGQVHTKGHPHAEPPRPRLIAAVSAEQKRAVSEAAKAAGMTEARWIRIKLGLEE